VLSRIAVIARLAVLLFAGLFAGGLAAVRARLLEPEPLALAAVAGALVAAASIALVSAMIRAAMSTE
jgi:hypothetical protein